MGMFAPADGLNSSLNMRMSVFSFRFVCFEIVLEVRVGILVFVCQSFPFICPEQTDRGDIIYPQQPC